MYTHIYKLKKDELCLNKKRNSVMESSAASVEKCQIKNKDRK